MLQQLADQWESNRIIKTILDEILKGNHGDLIMYHFETKEFRFAWMGQELLAMSDRARAMAMEHLFTVSNCRAKVAPHALSKALSERSWITLDVGKFLGTSECIVDLGADLLHSDAGIKPRSCKDHKRTQRCNKSRLRSAYKHT